MRHNGLTAVVLQRSAASHRILVAVALLAAWVPMAVTAGTWQGKETTKDGVVHVMSPAMPVEDPTSIKLDRVWEISGDDEDEFFFGVLSQVCSDAQGNLYLLDAQLNEVMIFSRDGEYTTSIGREGEGPGEFRRPSDLFLTPDGNVAVMQRMPGKIVLLTKEGDPAGELSVPQPDGGGMQMLQEGRSAGDQVVLGLNRFSRDESGFEMHSSLVSIDLDGKQTAEFVSRSDKRSFANMNMDETTLGRNALIWAVGKDGRVYTSENFHAYQVTEWAPDGNRARVVEREYEPRVRSEEEIKDATPRIRFRGGGRTQEPEVKMSKTHRDIQDIFPREDGGVWILSSRGAFGLPNDVLATFDVFDREGRFTHQITLKGEGDFVEDGFHIVGDRLIVVTGFRSAQRAMFGGRDGDDAVEEEEAKPMSVVCYDLRPMMASK